MADYKELLRRAIEALPENNGAARRAVYEKARAALVGQLRGITPPLAARDITTHRLQLEDCIRQVEQEASEANISGIGQEPAAATPPSLPPVFASEAKANPAKAIETTKPAETARAASKASGKADPSKGKPSTSIEAIIAAAEREKPEREKAALEKAEREKAEREKAERAKQQADKAAREKAAAAEKAARAEPPPAPQPPRPPELKPRPTKSQPVLVARSDQPMRTLQPKPEPEPQVQPERAAQRPAASRPASRSDRPMPSIVARAEAAKGRAIAAPTLGVAVDNTRRGPTIEPRRDGRLSIAAARQPELEDYETPEDLAMSSVREVEVEPQPVDPQRTIDRAIAALDREARGDLPPADYDDEPEYEDEPMLAPPRRNAVTNGRGDTRREMNARGEANGRNGERARALLEAPMEREVRPSRPAKEFAKPRRSAPQRAANVPRAQSERGGMGAVTIFVVIFVALLVGAGGAGVWAWQEGFINLDAMFGKGNTVVAAQSAPAVVTPDSTGPGNTDTPAPVQDSSTELKSNARLPAIAEAAPVTPASSTAPLALQAPAADGKTEVRLGDSASQAQSAQDATVAAIDPSTTAGSQSLLLEASDTGKTGAVPFSGTVDWSKGVDENGLPTLVGKAEIPARNLSVQMLIRKNSDPSLPASHLMEITFTVADSFVGGSIAGLPGVLLKNEELVQGTPLVGASARVVGNSFLFALSAAPEDSATNVNLLTTRKWIDLALIYASGKRAIITLEKDDKAQKLFSDVFAAWGPVATPAAPAAAASAAKTG